MLHSLAFEVRFIYFMLTWSKMRSRAIIWPELVGPRMVVNKGLVDWGPQDVMLAGALLSMLI